MHPSLTATDTAIENLRAIRANLNSTCPSESQGNQTAIKDISRLLGQLLTGRPLHPLTALTLACGWKDRQGYSITDSQVESALTWILEQRTDGIRHAA